jgi:hypothetical protein
MKRMFEMKLVFWKCNSAFNLLPVENKEEHKECGGFLWLEELSGKDTSILGIRTCP